MNNELTYVYHELSKIITLSISIHYHLSTILRQISFIIALPPSITVENTGMSRNLMIDGETIGQMRQLNKRVFHLKIYIHVHKYRKHMFEKAMTRYI